MDMAFVSVEEIPQFCQDKERGFLNKRLLRKVFPWISMTFVK
jgi:hypothetical protein